MKPYDNKVTWKALIADVQKVVFRRIRKASKVPLSEVLSTTFNQKLPGVYLIYDLSGEILYVGSSADVKGRLWQHLNPDVRNSLIERLAKDELLGVVGTPEFQAAVEALRKRMFETFKVTILDATDGFGYSPRGVLETLVQWTFKPKYGCWPAPWKKDGWVPIQESLQEAQ